MALLKMEICSDIIKKASKCSQNFACIKNPNENTCCKVKDCINNAVHFIELANYKSCPYLMHFGDGHICNCPVRKEIFNKYRI